MIIYLKIAFLT